MLRSSRSRSLFRLMPLLVILLSAHLASAAPSTPAEFTVTETVVADDIEPVGCNIGKITGGTNFTTNQLVPSAGYEPAYDRYLRRIDRAGSNWLEWDSFGGVDEYDLNASGWGNGGTARFYRIVDADGNPLSYNGGTDMSDITGADHVILLGEATIPYPSAELPNGGWDSENNRVYIDRSDLGLRFGDYVIITIKTTVLTAEMSHDRLSQWFNPNAGFHFAPSEWNRKLVEHDYGTLPQAFVDDDPGETCLEVEATTSDTKAFGNWLFHDYDYGEGLWYSQLHPGAPYKVDVWLRQEGIPSGEVRFTMGQSYSSENQSTPWMVTGTWQKYSYEFTGPAWPVGDRYHPSLELTFTGPGKLYVDNFIVYRNDADHEFRPFTPGKVAFDELMDWVSPVGKKPTIRFYNSSYATHSPMERMCSDWTSSRVDFIKNINGTVMISTKHCLMFAIRTGDSPATRIVPHLTLSEEYTEEDWMKLVEYLGVPYDPSTDTPESKPMAYLRYSQRGTGTPWSDEFREIVIEYGNETWHNGAGGYGWHGFGKPSFVHRGGREYGMFAHYMFEEHVAKMPEWSQYNLGDKIRFIVNGGYPVGVDEYGEAAIRECDGSAVRYVSHANYIGPKWETGDDPYMSFDVDGMQRTLVAGSRPGMTDDYLAMHRQFRDDAAAQGLHYDLVAYEGGPSGYIMQSIVNQKAFSELYGKSAGMGTATLDVYLFATQAGYKHQNFFAFGASRGWCSHTMPEMGGFRPHASWLAVKMRNRYLCGDRMLEVQESSMPTYTEGDITYELAGCYAAKGENVYTIVLTNRKIEGSHNNNDFGDGTTPVTVHLPFDNPAVIRLYKLAHADGTPVHPMQNNFDTLMYNGLIRDASLHILGNPIPDYPADTMPVRIYEQDIPLSAFSTDFVVNESTGGVAGGLPQGAAFMYVFALDSTALSVKAPSTEELMQQGLQEGAGGLASRSFGTGQPQAAPASSPRPVRVPQPSPTSGPVSEQAGTALVADGSPLTVSLPDMPPRLETVSAPDAATPAAPPPHTMPSVLTAGQAHEVDYTAHLPPTLAVKGIAAASSKQPNVAANTMDRDLRTRWSPDADAAEKWLCIDLGRVQRVSSATIIWYGTSRRATPFTVEVSTDGKQFLRVHAGALHGRGTSTLICDFDTVSGRYVRIAFDGAANAVSVYEVGLHGQSSSVARSE